MEAKFEKLRLSRFAKGAPAAAAAVGGVMAMGPGNVLAMLTTATGTGAFTINAGNATWHLNNNITFATTSSNWGFSEGSLTGGAFNDAFDGAISFLVALAPAVPGNTDGYKSPGGQIDISPAYPTNPATDTTATGSVQVMAGLNVHGQFYFLHNKAIARHILVMQNPTAAPITVNVAQVSNWGSDSNTTYEKTSSGDALADPSDNWYITRQDSPPGTYSPSDPPLTYVFNGAGATKRGVPNPIPVTGDGITNMYWNAITIPPGETRSIMVFIEMSTSLANATADSKIFASPTSMANAGLLAGIPPGVAAGVVNFNGAALAAALNIPTMSEWALIAMAWLLGLFGFRQLSKTLPRRDAAAS